MLMPMAMVTERQRPAVYHERQRPAVWHERQRPAADGGDDDDDDDEDGERQPPAIEDRFYTYAAAMKIRRRIVSLA